MRTVNLEEYNFYTRYADPYANDTFITAAILHLLHRTTSRSCPEDSNPGGCYIVSAHEYLPAFKDRSNFNFRITQSKISRNLSLRMTEIRSFETS